MLIIVIIIAGYLTFEITSLREENQHLAAAQVSLTENMNALSTLNEKSNTLLQELTLEVQQLNHEKLELQNALNNTITLDNLSIQKLNEAGYSDYTLLLNDLMDQNHLIPFEGLLGGSMAWRPEASFVLNHQWVYATFDDGHINGYGLLKFSIDPNGHISWTLIDAVLLGDG